MDSTPKKTDKKIAPKYDMIPIEINSKNGVKLYITVSERLKYFRSLEKYDDCVILEQIITNDVEQIIVQVNICRGEDVISMAHAHEFKKGFINSNSFLENAFTSALGRSLGYLGIGLLSTVASADEKIGADNKNAGGKGKRITDEQLSAMLHSFKSTKEFQNLKTYNLNTKQKELAQTKYNDIWNEEEVQKEINNNK